MIAMHAYLDELEPRMYYKSEFFIEEMTILATIVVLNIKLTYWSYALMLWRVL